jgi:hypothetical protein
MNIGLRRAALFPLLLVLLQAFVMAPYQHVHLHQPSEREGKANHDHRQHGQDDSALVHIHFYAFSAPESSDGTAGVEDSRGGHVSVALDSFATLPHVGIPAFVKPQIVTLLFPPEGSVARMVEVAEPRGHDPPSLDLSSPRAPPV